MASNRKRAALGACLALLLAWPAAADDQKLGRELWGLCQQCHMQEGTGNPDYLAPSIAGLPQWYVQRQLQKFHDGIRGTHFDDIPGMRMRPMALWLKDEAYMAAVAAHVAALPAVKPAPQLQGGDATRGQALYAPCIACHGPEGQGNEVLGAPPLNHSSDWYLLTQLQHFKHRVRGAAPGDVQGAAMLGMVTLLPDDQAMKDVIAYIQTFPAR